MKIVYTIESIGGLFCIRSTLLLIKWCKHRSNSYIGATWGKTIPRLTSKKFFSQWNITLAKQNKTLDQWVEILSFWNNILLLLSKIKMEKSNLFNPSWQMKYGWTKACTAPWIRNCMHKWMNAWMHEWMNKLIDEWKDEWMKGWLDERMNGWMGEWMIGWINGWMNKLINKWMNKWMNDWIYRLGADWL